ncbi:hypothetical protein [Kaarinaea lacus]
MQRLSIIAFLVFLICAGCATPDKLSKRDVRDISSISIVINTTITNDAPGFTDSVDVPLSKALSDKFLGLIKSNLEESGFRVVDHHLSAGMAHSREKFYVIAADTDRERDISDLEIKQGPYYSDRLDSQQLKAVYQEVADQNDIPTLGQMGFNGDATLVVLVQGRLIGIDKSIGAYFTNAAIITLFIAGGGGSFGGSPELMDTNDSYLVQLRMYSTKDGDILWQRDIKAHAVAEVLDETANSIKNRIAAKL